ncbi:proline-tRNA ligase [Actinidia rufa]|uniref:Proline-tRNA ligase n=1 Tax=Actinidia rufa TaxID=165716 RepID=A0A7J0H550_9ERIC|nr:proline-tRNA ligase [Actinidia rufa]
MRSLRVFNLLLVSVVTVFLSCGYVLGKQCTNIPTELSSHGVRYELLSSNNETWKEEMFSHYHLIPTDDSAWSNLLPRKILREEDELDWLMMYRKMKNSGGFQNLQGDFLKEVSLHDVRLDPESKHGQAQQTNLEYLLILDVDSLVWSFRKTAGLQTPGKAYGGWEAPTCELRGHFVGHYMSASAQMWASTHNNTLKEKMSAVVSALSACQDKMGTGYLSAFPSEQFDRFEAIKPVWAPYYTIHKIMAGLLDQHTFAGNAQALKMLTWMVDYFYDRVQNVIMKYTIERHWLSLNEETGGMNDVLYKLYAITGDPKHLLLAHLFDKPCFLGLLAVKADDISGFHANTHIPIVIGSQMRYEVTGDSLYQEIGTFFMDIVNSSHSYATGGTSVSEFWSDPKRLASTLQNENEESCTTYNMLKVSRHLFRWTKEMAYADYYERALTNGVLGIQRGREPGVMIYMLPQGRGGSKARSFHGWGTKFDSFWCCYGTGIESFSKLGDSIYFEEEGQVPGLYLIQYISSSLNWKSGQVFLNQKVEPASSWNSLLQVTLTISSQVGAGLTSTLHLRIPLWTYSNGAKAILNGQELSLPTPGNFLSITRKWSAGDKITLELPVSLRIEGIKDDRPEYASIQAILYGPYLLAGLTNGDWDIKTESAASLSDYITPIPSAYNSHLISLSQESGDSTLVLTNSNHSITMEKFPESGTDSSLNATFRLVLKDSTTSSSFSKPKDFIGKSVMLEPFNFPGMVVAHQGEDESLGISDSSDGKDSVFHLVPGLDGKAETVSLESQEGCFVIYKSSSSLQISCKSGSSDAEFDRSASFVMRDGISEYHPMSFVGKGSSRNFLLTPLLSLRDESYTLYFNIQS